MNVANFRVQNYANLTKLAWPRDSLPPFQFHVAYQVQLCDSKPQILVSNTQTYSENFIVLFEKICLLVKNHNSPTSNAIPSDRSKECWKSLHWSCYPTHPPFLVPVESNAARETRLKLRFRQAHCNPRGIPPPEPLHRSNPKCPSMQ